MVEPNWLALDWASVVLRFCGSAGKLVSRRVTMLGSLTWFDVGRMVGPGLFWVCASLDEVGNPANSSEVSLAMMAGLLENPWGILRY